MTTLPLDFPGLEAEARRMVGDILDTGLDGSDTMRLANTAQPLIRAHARLLADLTRPESRDRWAWAMAAHMGWKVAGMTTAPAFFLAPATEAEEDADSQPAAWCLSSHGLDVTAWFGGSSVDDAYLNDFTAYVPGLPLDPEQRIEAFRLILHAVFGVTP